MDRNRIRKAAMGKRAAAARTGATGREKIRLIAYGLLIVVIGGYFAARPADKEDAAVEAVRHPVSPRNATPIAVVDVARLTAVRDDTPTARAVLEPDARDHLVSQAGRLVFGDMEQLGVRALPRATVVSDPGAHRGAPLSVLGRLLWYEPELATTPHTFRGEIEDEQGGAWTFLVVNLPWGLEVGEVVRVSGFFFKLHDMLRPDRTFATGPLLVAEELLPSAYRIAPVKVLRDDLFLGTRDLDLSDASRPLDSLAYFELLSYVQNTAADVLFGPVATREPIYARDMRSDPTRWRGRAVTVRGKVLHTQRSSLGPMGENPLGIPWVWEVYLLNSVGGPTRAITLEEPVGIEPDMTVDVDGIFFRRFAYENKFNDPIVSTVIIAGDVRPFVIPPDEITPFIQRFVLFGGLGLVALIVLAQRREGRQRGRDRHRSADRKKKLIALPGTLHRAPPGREGEGDGTGTAHAPPATPPPTTPPPTTPPPAPPSPSSPL